LTRRANQRYNSVISKEALLPAHRQQHSDLVEIARRNGDFRRNYGKFLGAFLYLRSLNAARGRPFTWAGFALGLLAVALPWITKPGWRWP
jgi:hypothetical protein